MSDPVLEVHNLSKNFGPFQAVDSVSFAVPRGKVVGLLGPNGAGKTTTIHMLLGITSASSGTVRYFGKDFASNRIASLQRINFASSYNTLLGRITSYENLLTFARLYQVKNPDKKINQLAEDFDAADLLPQLYYELSAGQRTRINLMKSLLNNPELILMDEPTASLDPDIADRVLNHIEKLKAEHNISLLYTSHDMEEVTRLCDEVIFLDHGKIVAHDTPLNLTRSITLIELRIVFEGNQEQVEKLLQEKQLKYAFSGEHIVNIHTDETKTALIVTALVNSGLQVTDVEIKKPNLEDVFLQIARGGTRVV